jgi:hypothetical protein
VDNPNPASTARPGEGSPPHFNKIRDKLRFDRLRVTGTPGCYLQTLVENTRAVDFFERMGFRKHGPTPVVPGIRDKGRRLHQQTMVGSA